ncbi:hypothetical protein [Viridibacillus arvi]|uniref:hypothetical protein n=1 Tax=Viridibacillus arvi TaxID=263475 RepID=UPI0034CDCC2C
MKIILMKALFLLRRKDNQSIRFLLKPLKTEWLILSKSAGVNKELTPHSLRHTHTSLLAKAKV